jgi:hypothetical protein
MGRIQGLLEGILEASTWQGWCAACRAGAMVGSDWRPDTHYRTCIKGQGSNHIKIEKKQFDRRMVARGGDDHNHGASCAPKVEKKKSKSEAWQRIGNTIELDVGSSHTLSWDFPWNTSKHRTSSSNLAIK